MSDIGMQIARMKAVVTAISNARSSLRALESDATSRVNVMNAYWHGDAKEAYMNRWAKAEAAMQETIVTLTRIQTQIEAAIEALLATDKKGAGIAGG